MSVAGSGLWRSPRLHVHSSSLLFRAARPLQSNYCCSAGSISFNLFLSYLLDNLFIFGLYCYCLGFHPLHILFYRRFTRLIFFRYHFHGSSIYRTVAEQNGSSHLITPSMGITHSLSFFMEMESIYNPMPA